MLSLLFALSVVAAASPAAPATSLSLVGFADDDQPALTAELAREVATCAQTQPTTTAVPPSCDDACLVAHAAGAPLIVIEALRVGGDVDVDEKRVVDGVLVSAKRTAAAATFQTALLSPEACAALAPPTTATDATPTLTPQPTTPPLDIHPGLFVVGAGALVAVVGFAVFAEAASTVESAKAPGVDKERAAVTGWVGLAAVVVGVGAAAGGAAWSVVDP